MVYSGQFGSGITNNTLGEPPLSEENDDSVSLREHLESIMRAEHNLNESRHHASLEALAQFRHQAEARFASVNEFRGTLQDQALTFATRDTVEALQKEVLAISNRLAVLEARLLASGGLAVFVLGIASVLVVYFHK